MAALTESNDREDKNSRERMRDCKLFAELELLRIWEEGGR